MSFNEILDFIFENYYKRIGFSEENSHYLVKNRKERNLQMFAIKLIKKCLILKILKDTINYFLRKKNTKSVKQKQNNYPATKNF